VSFTVRGPTRIPAGELREAEITWLSIGERGGIDREPATSTCASRLAFALGCDGRCVPR
jgi:hypothetical protein